MMISCLPAGEDSYGRSHTSHLTRALPFPTKPVCAPGYDMSAATTTSAPSPKPTCQKCAPGFVSGPEAPLLPAAASSSLPAAAPAGFNGSALGRAGGMRQQQQGSKQQPLAGQQKQLQQQSRDEDSSGGCGHVCVQCPAGTTANADQTKCA